MARAVALAVLFAAGVAADVVESKPRKGTAGLAEAEARGTARALAADKPVRGRLGGANPHPVDTPHGHGGKGVMAELKRARPTGRRPMSDDEAQRCAGQIDAVLRIVKRDALNVSLAVAQTPLGFSLAVYAPTVRAAATQYSISSSLLATGKVAGDAAPPDLAWAERRLLARPSEWAECVAPPCHSHVLVDVGAHVGWWTFSAAKRGWYVVAVEADTVNLALLNLSLCLNPTIAPRIKIVEKLVAGMGGRKCVLAAPAKHLGNGTIVCTLNHQEVEWTQDDIDQLIKHSQYSSVKAYTTTTLDEILRPIWQNNHQIPGRASMLRLDVGGVGGKVLQGMPESLKAGRFPIIHRDGVTLEDAQAELLTASGYELHDGPCHTRWNAPGDLTPRPAPAAGGATGVPKGKDLSTTKCARLPLPDKFKKMKESIVQSRQDRAEPHAGEHKASGRYGEREMTHSEQMMCTAEIGRLATMNVDYGVVQTIKGFTLAVLKHRTEDRCAGELLKSGRCEEGVAFRALEHARSVVEALPKQWRTCRQPPCHEHLAIDVGAHSGWWSFSTAARGWKTIAVDASPISYALLRLSRCLNPPLQPYLTLSNNVVSGHNRTCVYYTVPGNAGNRVKCLDDTRPWTAEDTAALPSKNVTVHTVETRTMGSILDQHWNKDAKAPKVGTFMRVNVAGVDELAVFKNMEGFLNNARLPFIWKVTHGKEGKEPFLGYLIDKGYTIRKDNCMGGARADKKTLGKFAAEFSTEKTNLCSRLDLSKMMVPLPKLPFTAPIVEKTVVKDNKDTTAEK